MASTRNAHSEHVNELEESAELAPRYHTPRNPTRPTRGHLAAETSRLLGEPFLEWQARAADVALEYDPATGKPDYWLVIVTVPRQSGKTTLARAIGVTAMLGGKNRNVFYTAQTGKDARERWQDLTKRIDQNAAISSRFRIFLGAGAPRLHHYATGSRFSPFPPNPEALHGYTPDLVMLDEAFTLDETQGELLLGAIIPAQNTLPDAQIWIISTLGTEESVFLDKWITAAREGTPGICLIDYGAPAGIDIYNPELWPTFHPALGTLTDTEKLHQAASSLSRSEFERAYANRKTAAESSLIAAAELEALTLETMPLPSQRRAVIAYDVAHDRTTATLSALWLDLETGNIHATILERAPGYLWLLDRVPAWAADALPAAIVADDGGAAREISAALQSSPPVTRMGGRDAAAATGNLLSLISSKRIRFDSSPAWAAAARVATTRAIGEVSTLSRRHSPGDISPLIAAAAAAYYLQTTTTDTARPFIVTVDS